MKKLFLIPLMACAMLFSTNLQAVNVDKLADLKNALTNGGEITLTADIDAGSDMLTISQATVINGQGHHIKSTNTYVFQMNTTGDVVMKNLIIWSAKTSRGGQGINVAGTSDADPSKAKFLNDISLTLENVTINATGRGMNVINGDNINLTINNCTIQNITSQTLDAHGNPTSANYDLSLTGATTANRGVNFGHITNSTITINNSTLQGFFYELNNITGYDPDNGIMTGCKVIANNSTFKGRAALNVWGYGGEYEFTDCKVTGINNYGGGQEGFACFVFNYQGTCHDNTLTINGGTIVSAVFNETGSTNPNANQFFVADRATNNTIVINNAQYTCTKELGPQKGGLFENVGVGSTATVNGGIYDCPEIIGTSYGNGGQVVINNGDFDVLVVTETALYPDGYESYFTTTANNITVNGGTFQIASGEDITDLSFQANSEVAHASIVGDGYVANENKNGSTSVITTAVAAGTQDIDVDTDIETNTTAERVDIANGKKLVVKSGKTLTVGEGGIVFGNEFDNEVASMTIEPGATVILKGMLYNAEASNVIIQSDAVSGNQGVILIEPKVGTYAIQHPEATFEIVSRSFRKDGKNTWQRFGIPSFVAITGMTTEATGITTYIYDFDNAQNDWRQLGSFTTAADAELLAKMRTPFACYNMVCNATEPGTKYTISGNLVGNEDAVLNMGTQYNTFANSYSGKINMEQILSAMYDNDNVAVTIYAWKSTGNNTFAWEAVDLSNYDINDELHQNIQPMQSFIILSPGASGSQALDYTKMVWDPVMNPSPAPTRRALPAMNSKVQIVVRDANNNDDNVILIEGDQFSSANDRGYDAAKYMNENLNLYITTADSKMAHMATDNLEGQFIGMSCVEGGEFTMSFDNLNGETLVIRDMLTNATISMKEGETYTFTAENNSAMDYRFQVIGRANVATDVEEVEAAKTAGIYTLTGVYMGDVTMWNNLPQGVYVVNGEKKVK
jgi:hypothetical protein